MTMIKESLEISWKERILMISREIREIKILTAFIVSC